MEVASPGIEARSNAAQRRGECIEQQSLHCLPAHGSQIMGVKSLPHQARLLGKVSFAGATKCLILLSKASQGRTQPSTQQEYDKISETCTHQQVGQVDLTPVLRLVDLTPEHLVGRPLGREHSEVAQGSAGSPRTLPNLVERCDEQQGLGELG